MQQEKENNLKLDQVSYLVPVDFTDNANFAIKYACLIAKHSKSSVSLLHVINNESIKKFKTDDEIFYQDKLSALATYFRNLFDVSINANTVKGSIFDKIASVAENNDTLLTFLATHGKVGIQKFIGSYAYKVITSSNVPTVIIQNDVNINEFNGFSDIILLITPDKFAKNIIYWAHIVAHIFKSKIHLTHFNYSDTFLDNQLNNNLYHCRKFLNSQKFTDYIIHNYHSTDFNITNSLSEYSVKFKTPLISIITNPESFNIANTPWHEKILFNEKKIPVLCINPIDTYKKFYYGFTLH